MSEDSRQPVPVPREFLEHISEQLTSVIDVLQQTPQETDYIYYRLESVVEVVYRLAAVVSLPREDEIFHFFNSTLELLAPEVGVGLNFEERGQHMVVGKDQLQFLLEQRFKVHEIARMYGVSYSTIRRWMKAYKLSVRQTFSDISSENLKEVIQNFIGQYPNSGYRIVDGYLRSVGIRYDLIRCNTNFYKLHIWKLHNSYYKSCNFVCFNI